MNERLPVRRLADCEIEAIVVATSNVKERETEYMDSRIFDLAQRAPADGDESLSATYYFLSSVLRPRVEALANIDSSTNQFWVRPASLTPVELEVLIQVAGRVTDPELRSRFADYVWMKTRDHVFGEIAIDDYLESAHRLRDPEKWPASAARYERAVNVAAALGKKNERYRRAIATVEEYLAQLDGSDPLFLSERLMTILLDQKEGDRSRYAELATKCAEAAEGRANFYLSLHYWDLAIRWFIALNDPAREKTARISAAESVVKDAESRVSGDAPSFLVAAGLLQHAIAMLQKAGAPKERIEDVEMKLREYGALGVAELKPISSKFDASEIIAAARAAVTGKSLQEVIHAIADMIILPNRNAVRREVLDRAKKYPFSHMFPEVRVNAAGLTTAGRGSVNGDETDDSRNVLALMYQDVVQSLSIEAQAKIAPAWREMQNEHSVREADMAIVARQSWFVPPSRESFFAQGLAAGFNGDLITAIHLLGLQIEPAIRWNLQRRRVATLKLNREGHYEERDLNQLLAMPQSKALLGENLHFTLTAILTSRFGYNLRNDLAHGLVEPNDCYSPVSLYFWAVVLWICVRTAEVPPAGSAAEGPAD
jgi:hypothetical protein